MAKKILVPIDEYFMLIAKDIVDNYKDYSYDEKQRVIRLLEQMKRLNKDLDYYDQRKIESIKKERQRNKASNDKEKRDEHKKTLWEKIEAFLSCDNEDE